MIYDVSIMAIMIFTVFVLLVLGLSFYFAGKTKSAANYYAAGGSIHWGVNGIAFAGDYLSAASFLGICGMIAFSGYDGFLYSIGYLAGWIVALFVIAEPMKRLGKYTFADALDAKFNSRGIKFAAAISTLVVSIFYLIPQMVGAGDLVVPLLGLPHWMGVVIVGSVVIFIVATAGMTSTTYVQFLKGSLLIIFSVILTISILTNGLKLKANENSHSYIRLEASESENKISVENGKYPIISTTAVGDNRFAKIKYEGLERWFKVEKENNNIFLTEMLSITEKPNKQKLYNGANKEEKKFFQVGHIKKITVDGKEVTETGPVGPLKFLEIIENSIMVQFIKVNFNDGDDKVTGWYQKDISGTQIMKPGLLFKLENATLWQKINFISLMLALFFGTASLPHILIRYYTVKSQRDARKSTIVAIIAIGFFYVLTLYMGLGAGINGVLDLESSNMSAPLLAKYFGVGLFSIISAIAFATILGTVSGLIVATSGAIAHDFVDKYLNKQMDDKTKVKVGKIAALGVGVIAIILGILFKGMNVSFLVGLAFAVAASANLPAIVFLLFWKKTTAKGITASILTGIISSIGLILLSPSMFERYGFAKTDAIFPIDNPGLFTIPLSVIVLVIVSLMTQNKKNDVEEKVA